MFGLVFVLRKFELHWSRFCATLWNRQRGVDRALVRG